MLDRAEGVKSHWLKSPVHVKSQACNTACHLARKKCGAAVPVSVKYWLGVRGHGYATGEQGFARVSVPQWRMCSL